MILLKETSKHADYLTLQRLLTFCQDAFLSIRRPFVFDADYLNLLLPVKVGLCKHLWYQKEINSKLLQSITKTWDIS